MLDIFIVIVVGICALFGGFLLFIGLIAAIGGAMENTKAKYLRKKKERQKEKEIQAMWRMYHHVGKSEDVF